MTSTWLLSLAFLIYPLIVLKLNSMVRYKIPERAKRKKFKREKEYVIKLVYLIIPLLLFHMELFYLNAGYSFSEFSLLTLMALFFLQVFLLFMAVNSLYQLFAELKNFNH